MRAFRLQFLPLAWLAVLVLSVSGCASMRSSETLPTSDSNAEVAQPHSSEVFVKSDQKQSKHQAGLAATPFVEEIFASPTDPRETPSPVKGNARIAGFVPQRHAVRQVAYEEDLPEPAEAKPLLPALPQPPPDFEQVPTPASPPDRPQETLGVEEPFTVDLATALQLGGADALQIQIAREKVYQAQVELSKSRLILLPTLWYGVGWNHHDGPIQTTPGRVITTSRSSFYTGGGAGFEGAPTSGAGGGPGQFVLNLSLADAHFIPLEKRQLFQAATAARAGEKNDIILDIAIAYANILEARSELANNRQGLVASRDLVQLTTNFADAGQGAPAEVYRAKTEEAHWLRKIEDAERRSLRETAELARILRLGPEVRLIPVEHHLAPVAMVEESRSLDGLIATGLAARPELAEYQALAEARMVRFRQEAYRPFLPYVQLAGSVGAFGGSRGSSIDNAGVRDDIDALAVWEFKNLGLGNYLLKRRSRSKYAQAQLKVEDLQNTVISEVIQAATDVAGYRRQMVAASQGIEAADTSYQLNLDRIRNAAGLPLELVQAIKARTDAKNAYTEAISNYNRSQYRLMHAMGQPTLIAMP